MRHERRHRPSDFAWARRYKFKWPRGMGSICLWYVLGSPPPLEKERFAPLSLFPTTELFTTMNHYYGQTHKKNVCDEIPLAVVSPLSEAASPTTTTTTTTADACHCRIQQQYETMAIRALTNAARAVSSKAVGTSSSSSRGFSVLTAAEEFPG